jgi:hypothetical protein
VDVDVASTLLFTEGVERVKKKTIDPEPNFFEKFEERKASGSMGYRQCILLKTEPT